MKTHRRRLSLLPFGGLPDPTSVFRPPNVAPPGKKIPFGDIDPNKPTVIITHGLSDNNYDEVSADGNFDEILFSGFSSGGGGYLIKQQFGNKVNVIQYVWPEAFQGLSIEGYQEARLYTDDAGAALAKYLVEKLGKSYNKNIHFIGHSLGTIVNAHAARLYLDVAPSVPQAQVTILDYPARSERFGIGGPAIPHDFFATLLQQIQNKTNLKIDNYYSTNFSAFGETAEGRIYNHPNLVDPNEVGDEIFPQENDGGVFAKNHTGVQQWYRWTMNPEGFNGNNYCDNRNPAGFNTPQGMSNTLDPCQAAWYWSLFGQGGWGKFPTANIGAPIDINQGVQLDLGAPRAFGCEYESGVIICREQSSPFIIFDDITIPESAEYLSFDYRFPNIGDGDYVSVFFDDQPIWTLSAVNAINPSEFINSGPIPLPQDLVDGGHKLSVELFGVGEKNAQFELKNITTNGTSEYTAQGLKTQVRDNLNTVANTGGVIGKTIQQVVKFVTGSLKVEFWKDESHLNFSKGIGVFVSEAQAVRLMDTQLQLYKKWEEKSVLFKFFQPKPLLTPEIAHMFELAIHDLISADLMLATLSLDEAKAALSTITDQKVKAQTEKLIAQAEKDLKRAEEAVSVNKPTLAVLRYGKAWFFSQAALHVSEKTFKLPALPSIFSEDK